MDQHPVSITVSKINFNLNWKKVKFVYLFMTSDVEPNPVVFVIELGKNLIVW